MGTLAVCLLVENISLDFLRKKYNVASSSIARDYCMAVKTKGTKAEKSGEKPLDQVLKLIHTFVLEKHRA
ncbi:hypothetical protein ACHAXS_006503 [Conticribra weissflogii]